MEQRESGTDESPRAGTLTTAGRLRDFYTRRPTVSAFLITLFIVVFLLLPLWWMAGAWYEDQLISEERNVVAVDLSKYGSQLSQALNRRVSLVDGLSAFVLSDYSPETLNRTYDTFAAGLYTTTPGIRNFAVAPGGIQTYVYPLKGNENVPGHDILNDERPAVQASNRRTMESRRSDIRGPYELRQGGLGLVITRALFVNTTFWGFCSMVVDMPPILAEAGLSGQTGSLTLAVRNHDGTVFFGDPGLFAGDAVIQQFPVGTGTWEISGMPTSGWSAPLQRSLLIFRLTGLVIIGLIAALVFLITKTYVSVVIDLTERRRAEEQLKKFNEELERGIAERTARINASLEEKVILLREIHHRVKNNLQIIISLLNLQSRYIEDEKTRQVIHESQNRIRAMALVHEKLYQSTDISKIDLDNYIRFLGNNLLQFFGMKGKGITLTMDIKDISLAIDTAIPIGLMINELISNSLKYAFPDGRRGEISVTVHRQDHTLTILFKDNGVGIPSDFDWRNAKSLGLRLVISLVEQLFGTIELNREGGTAFTIVVKEKE